MTEGTEDSAAGQVVLPGSVSPTSTGTVVDAVGQAAQEKQDEAGFVGSGAGEKEEEEKEKEEEQSAGGDAEGVGGDDGGRAGALGILGLAGTCCVCIEIEHVNSCLRSEKICIVPILACLLSLALCTAGLKWVFVDKIFEYDAPTHLDPKRFGQDPIIISADPTRGLPVSFTHFSSSSTPVLSTTTVTITATRPEDREKEKSTRGPSVPHSTRVAQVTPTAALTYQADRPKDSGTFTSPKQTSYPRTTMEFNDIYTPTVSATSTTPATKTSSHVTSCNDKQKKYCVNGGECFTLEVMPGSTKFLCRCLSGYTGNRCQEIVPKRVMNPKQAEELYQKRVLTITGICIALLVVGILCVVAYCKTKKQRKKMHDRLRQSRQNERNNRASIANGPRVSNAPENVQLVNQDISKNATPEQHVKGNETETSFSCSQYASSAHQSTVTQASSQRSESVLSKSHSMVMSSGENSQHALPSQRGRLNAIGGATDLSAYPKKPSGPPPNPASDSAYSERYTSAAYAPTRHLASPMTPDSPLSESAPLSSLAESAPSMAVSPSGEDERPLLFAAMRQPSSRGRNSQVRISAHYNHGNDVQSAPPSPLITQHGSHQDHEVKAAANMATAFPENFTMTLANTNSNNNHSRVKTATANSHVLHGELANADGTLERSISESEPEDDAVGEDRPFLNTPLSDSSMDSSRTNPAPQRSPEDALQTSAPSAQCQPRSTCRLQ